MHSEPLDLERDDKLRWLQRLDRDRQWARLNDQRFCRCCAQSFDGHAVQLQGGTRPLGPVRATCPTPNCTSNPVDWIYPEETSAPAMGSPFGEVQVVRLKRKKPIARQPVYDPHTIGLFGRLKHGLALTHRFGFLS
jgi:hypothetical protein